MTQTNNVPGTIQGGMQSMPNYMSITSLDSTASFTGAWVDNSDGRIKSIAFTQLATNTGGTSNTLQTTLQGSVDGGTTAFTVLDSGGAAIQTTALDTSSANGSSTTASESEQTEAEGIDTFPPLVRLRSVQGGTSATLTGNIAMSVNRRQGSANA